jgi:hypothetical protein
VKQKQSTALSAVLFTLGGVVILCKCNQLDIGFRLGCTVNLVSNQAADDMSAPLSHEKAYKNRLSLYVLCCRCFYCSAGRLSGTCVMRRLSSTMFCACKHHVYRLLYHLYGWHGVIKVCAKYAAVRRGVKTRCHGLTPAMQWPVANACAAVFPKSPLSHLPEWINTRSCDPVWTGWWPCEEFNVLCTFSRAVAHPYIS